MFGTLQRLIAAALIIWPFTGWYVLGSVVNEVADYVPATEQYTNPAWFIGACFILGNLLNLLFLTIMRGGGFTQNSEVSRAHVGSIFCGLFVLSIHAGVGAASLIISSLHLALVLWKKANISNGWGRSFLRQNYNLIVYGRPIVASSVQSKDSTGFGNIKQAAADFGQEYGDIVFGTALLEHYEPSERLVDRAVHHGIVRPLMKMRWGNYMDPKTAPLLRRSFSGHSAVWSGAGGGKTVGVVVPQNLNFRGSLVQLDPKREVYFVCSRFRREKLGHKVFCLSPGWVRSDAMNVLAWIRPVKTSFFEDLQLVTAWIVPEPDSMDGSAKFFYESTKKLVFGILLTEFLHYKNQSLEDDTVAKPTLLNLYKWIFRGTQAVMDDLLATSAFLDQNPDYFGEYTASVREMLGSFNGMDSEKTWPGVLNSVQAELWWLGNLSIARMMSGEIDELGLAPGQDPSEKVLDPNMILGGKTDVYVCPPLKVLRGSPAVCRLILGALLNAHLNAEGTRKGDTLFCIDEAQALKKFDILHGEALSQGRGAGILLFAIFQSPDALDIAAGDKTSKAWQEQAMLQIWMSPGTNESAKLISERLGNMTVESISGNSGGSLGGQRGHGTFGSQTENDGMTFTPESRAVKSASEIFKLAQIPKWYKDQGAQYAVAIWRDMPSYIVGVPLYYMRPEYSEMSGVADANPYYIKGGEIAVPFEPLIKIAVRNWAANQDLLASKRQRAVEASEHEESHEAVDLGQYAQGRALDPRFAKYMLADVA